MSSVFDAFDYKTVSTANTTSKGIGAVINPYTWSSNWDVFLATNVLTSSVETLEIYLFLCIFYKKDPAASTVSYSDSTGAEMKGEHLFTDKTTLDGKAGGTGVQFRPNWPAKLWSIALYQSRGAAVRFYDLVGCSIHKPLREKNMVNYYRSKRMEVDCGRIAPFIMFAASNAPDFATALRNDKNGDAFIQYHTTAQSTGGLLEKMVGTMGDDMKLIFKFTNGDLDDIKFVSGNPTVATATMRLKPKVMMVFFAFLRTFNMFPDKYYWGERNEDQIKGGLYSKVVAAMKRYKEIMLNTDAIGAMSKDQLSTLF